MALNPARIPRGDPGAAAWVGAIWLINEAAPGDQAARHRHVTAHLPGEDIEFVDVVQGVDDTIDDPDSALRGICAGLT